MVAVSIAAIVASTGQIIATQETDAGGITTFEDLDESATPFYFKVRVTRNDMGVASLQLLVV